MFSDQGLRQRLDAEWDQLGGPAFREAMGRMGKDGWLVIGWPKEHGGQGRGHLEQFIFWDETWRARAPLPLYPPPSPKPPRFPEPLPTLRLPTRSPVRCPS